MWNKPVSVYNVLSRFPQSDQWFPTSPTSLQHPVLDYKETWKRQSSWIPSCMKQAAITKAKANKWSETIWRWKSISFFHIFNRGRMKCVYRDTKKERKTCVIMSSPHVSRVLTSSSFTQHRIMSHIHSGCHHKVSWCNMQLLVIAL